MEHPDINTLFESDVHPGEEHPGGLSREKILEILPLVLLACSSRKDGAVSLPEVIEALTLLTGHCLALLIEKNGRNHICNQVIQIPGPHNENGHAMVLQYMVVPSAFIPESRRTPDQVERIKQTIGADYIVTGRRTLDLLQGGEESTQDN